MPSGQERACVPKVEEARGMEAMLTVNPTAFVSYSWDGDDHQAWVRSLAERLRRDGVDVKLDQWEMAPGDQIPEFMERSIRDNDFVVIICTPRYRIRSDGRRGGVGYEGDIMTGEVMTQRNRRKFIPVWRSGGWEEAAPSWLSSSYRIDLTGDPYDEEEYEDLLMTLRRKRTRPPPVGVTVRTRSPLARGHEVRDHKASPPHRHDPFVDIRILGVIVEEVTHPRNDGTRGSALYTVPFRLSGSPRALWANLFVKHWNSPARFTLRHRPGIARVSGDRLLLEGTTIEEVDEVHRPTLKFAIEAANREYREITRRKAELRRAAEAEQDRHRRNVEDVVSKMTFD